MSKELGDYCLESCEDFDPDRLTVTTPYIHTYKGNGKQERRSMVTYRNDKGKECRFFFTLPERSIAGIYPSYKYGQEQTSDTHNGYQFGYSMTSLESMKKPTKSEKAVKNVFDSISAAVHQRMGKEYKRKGSVLPQTCKASIAMAGDDVYNAVKCPYAHPNKDDPTSKGDKKKKIPDTSKPQSTYIKFQCYGAGRQLKTITKIYGPGDRQLDPEKCKKPGNTTPIVFVECVYYGTHGDESTCGASVRYKAHELNYTATVREHKRFIKRNTAPVVDDDDSEDEEERKASGSESEDGSSDGVDEFKDPVVPDSESEEESLAEDSPPPKRKAKKGKAEKPAKGKTAKPSKPEKSAKEIRREKIAAKKKLSKK
jgi:hypothetical protein